MSHNDNSPFNDNAFKYDLLNFLNGYRLSSSHLKQIAEAVEVILVQERSAHLELIKKETRGIDERCDKIVTALSKLHHKVNDEILERSKEDSANTVRVENLEKWKTWLCGSLVSLALAILGVYFK